MDNEFPSEVVKTQPEKTRRFFSFGTIVENRWPDGSRSYEFKISDSLRTVKPDSSDAEIKRAQEFADYGTIHILKSDYPQLFGAGFDAFSIENEVTVSVKKR